MYIKRLALTNFRNFSRLNVNIPVGPVLIHGDNAQGKTNLLEAIFFLANFTSFHAEKDQQLIRFSSEDEPVVVARIMAEFHRAGGDHELEVRIIQETQEMNGYQRIRKEVLLDGSKKTRKTALGSMNAVMFLPQMMLIVEGSPEERRRYINLTLSQIIENYAQHLIDYKRVLSQRNALLKQLREMNGDVRQLDYWDEQLSDSAGAIIFHRFQTIREIESLAIQVHQDLTGGSENLRIVYQPSYNPAGADETQYAFDLAATKNRSELKIQALTTGFLEMLSTQRKEDIQSGMTKQGPHRDEIRFFANGIDLGVFGSRGQGRTAMLSLKIAETAWMKQKTGEWPVLLLDEVMAELDQKRRGYLLSKIDQCEQALLTTTDRAFFDPLFIPKFTNWKISTGKLELL